MKMNILPVYQNSNYIKDVVGYIAEFVVRSILKRIQCEVCAKEIKSHETNSLLLNKKNVYKHVNLNCCEGCSYYYNIGYSLDFSCNDFLILL